MSQIEGTGEGGSGFVGGPSIGPSINEVSNMAAITGKEFLEASRAAKDELLNAALSSGPVYQGKSPVPLVWWDQYFVRNVTPSGTVESAEALRVGATQSWLDVVVVANHANTGALTVPSGATMKLELLQSDTADGTFEAVGPAVTIAAPADGITAEPDRQVARFVVGNTVKPWVKAKLTITGSITGGKIDLGLALMPR